MRRNHRFKNSNSNALADTPGVPATPGPVQRYNRTLKRWQLIDPASGDVLKTKRDTGPYKNAPKG